MGKEKVGRVCLLTYLPKLLQVVAILNYHCHYQRHCANNNFFPFSLTLITNKIFNAYKKSFLFSLNSYKFIHSIFIRISELIVPITVCFNPRYSTTTKLYFYARCFRNILFFAEEHEVRHTNPRFEIGVKVASESYEFPSLRASFLFSLSLSLAPRRFPRRRVHS